MSLMRLLEMNQSVGAASGDSHRYTLHENFLPKFAPVGRPVSLAPAKTQTQEPAMETPSLFERSNANGAADAANSAPQVLSVGVFPKQESDEPSFQAPPEKPGFFAKIKNLFMRKKTSISPIRAVQTEWMLDKVRVVRNDLNDCDLDVVVADLQRPAAPRAKGKSLVGRAWKHVEVPVEKPEPVETLK